MGVIGDPRPRFDGKYGHHAGRQDDAGVGEPGTAKPTWTSAFDLLGRVISKTDPDGGTSKNIKYDGAGNLTESTDSRGKTTSYSYDALSRKTGEFASAATAQIPANPQTGTTGNQLAAWFYDNSNNVANVTHAIGQLTTTISYQGSNAYTAQQADFNIFGESLGSSVTIPPAEGALAGSYTVKHLYTANTGLLLKDVYPATGGLPAEQVLHTYRSAYDLPDSLGGLGSYTQTTSYDALSQVNQTTFGPSTSTYVAVGNTYDPNSGRLTDSLVSRTAAGATTPLDQQTYRYDLVGNILGQTGTRQATPGQSETQCFGYDGLDQLVGAWTAKDNCATEPTTADSSMVADPLGASSAYWTTWSFDDLGDRKVQTEHALPSGPTADTITKYDYGTDGQQPHTLTSTTTTGAHTGSTSYRYDTSGGMISRNAGQGNQTIGYDDAGRLTSITGSAGGDSRFTYDADGTLLIQRDPGTTTLYLGDQQFSLATATNAVSGTRYYAMPGGGRVVRTSSGAGFGYELTDQHDTAVLYLDSQTASPQWRQYTPYGGPRGASVTPFDNRGFLNKATDANTGLTIVGARQYDPDTGRFITLDPILEQTDTTQLNGYGYAGNNPVVHADPTGLRADNYADPHGNTQARPPGSDDNPHGSNGGHHGGGDSGSANGGSGHSGGHSQSDVHASPTPKPKSKCGFLAGLCQKVKAQSHRVADWVVTNQDALGHMATDASYMVGGLLLMGVGGGAEGVGVLLDGTIIFSPAGIALNLLGAAALVGGGAMAGTGASKLGQDARDLQWNAGTESEGGAASKGNSDKIDNVTINQAHIANGHTPEGIFSNDLSKTEWLPGTTEDSRAATIKDVLRRGKVVTDVPNRDGIVKELKYKDPIGRDRSLKPKPLHTMRVYYDPDENVVRNAFPVAR